MLLGLYRATKRVLIWCGARECTNIGANEGCVGDDEEKAFRVFADKFSGKRQQEKSVDMTDRS